MRRRAVEALAVLVLAAIVTVAMAAGVLGAPSDRMFGRDTVGRHHDPFTVMRQFGRPIGMGVYSQPITDIAGAALARISGEVAAYNWLVLLSFPLSAAAAFLLARHLSLSRAGATVAAMAYAFSPFHVAHAAYHPHIAQTQWLPLYLLALWRCLEAATPAAAGWLGAATVAVTLSNFYGGFIAAVITPVAVAAYWLVMLRGHPQSGRRLGVTIGTLMLMAACGVAYAMYAAADILADRAAFAFPRVDLFRYSAKWWSYLVPPVAHPLLGDTASGVWNAVGVREGLLEQQVSLGAGIVALGFVAVLGWWVHDRQAASVARGPVLVIVAVFALVCSLSPERTIGAFTFVRPSALLYDVVPMFRSYARFGLVVQLMAALLAGIGVDRLRRARTSGARFAWVLLVALAAAEYAVAPSTQWRDVLPTAAHRWVMQQGDRVRALDCTPLAPESESVEWLTGGRVTLLGGRIGDCTDPHLPEALAANGFTHLLVRRGVAGARSWTDPRHGPDGLQTAARFDDGQVFTVTARTPAIYTAAQRGFHRREQDAEWAWRWMGGDAEWTIVNTGPRPVVATLDLEASAFHRSRRMGVLLDGQLVQTIVVEPARRVYPIGPLTVPPGERLLVFRPDDAPTVAREVIANGDPRRLSFALGTWHWSVQGEQP